MYTAFDKLFKYRDKLIIVHKQGSNEKTQEDYAALISQLLK